MFETSSLQKCTVKKEPNTFDSQVWERVELIGSEPWLFVVYTNKDVLRRNYIKSHEFLSSYKQIVSLARNSDINFECIALASPGRVNLSDSWMFDEVSEIWEGVEQESKCEQTGVVYVLKDGSRLAYSRRNDEKTLLDLHRVYPPQFW